LKTIESFQINGKWKRQPKLKARHWMPPGYGRCRIYADVVVVSRVTYKGTVGVICRDDQGCIIDASALVVPNLKPWKQWLVWRQ
jgi:hypothetical protein